LLLRYSGAGSEISRLQYLTAVCSNTHNNHFDHHPMKFAVGAIFKNEDAYVLEWLAFHKVVGFSRFVIADNGSTDLTRQILSTLEKHEPITVVDYPDEPDVRPQLGAYNLLTKMCPS